MDKKVFSGVILLTSLMAAMAGSVVTYDGTPYYCESRDLVCIGQRLSDSTKTCYYDINGTEKGVRCTEGWTAFSTPKPVHAESVEIFANNCLHTCDYQDTLKTYDLCYCDNGQFAYAGELI